uniref:Uncharacterized protein n=1 Tax=Anguilla anguilla TaxID=7936 RepID=A0A0E9P677_ANGAN
MEPVSHPIASHQPVRVIQTPNLSLKMWRQETQQRITVRHGTALSTYSAKAPS